jgi:cellulose synthase/poly-beta-1,6-N-acetylglucosamine synthase-like glycosyltransferase
MLLIAWSSFLIWLVLVFARGGFWRVQPAAPLSDTTLHAVGKAEIARHGAWPALVAVVPARNEADVIGRAVGSLLKQEYAGSFRVIVVDDHSADGTADAAQSAARELGLEDRLTVLTAAPLPPGWSGKVWAQSQGIEAIEKLGVPAPHRRRHPSSCRCRDAARRAGDSGGPRSGVADGAAALRFAVGEGADSGVRVFLCKAVSVFVGERREEADRWRGGWLHDGAA